MQKYLKVMSLSAEYVSLQPSPAVQLHWFPGKDASAHYTREEKGCVDTFRLRERGDERGEYVRPPLVAWPPHRISAFRTHNLGMSGTTLTIDGQKEVHILLYARIILWAGFCCSLMENKNVWLRRAWDVVRVRCSEFGGSASRGFIMYYF